MQRITITAKEISSITGKSESYARRVLRDIKHQLKKEKHHFVTIKEYCQYFNLSDEEVKNALNYSKLQKQRV